MILPRSSSTTMSSGTPEKLPLRKVPSIGQVLPAVLRSRPLMAISTPASAAADRRAWLFSASSVAILACVNWAMVIAMMAMTAIPATAATIA